MPEVALFNPFRRMTGAGVSDRSLALDAAVLDAGASDARLPAGHPSIEGGMLHYRLVRASRRTIAIHAGVDGVEVRAPLRGTLSDIESFMRQKARWILRRLADARPVAPFHWVDGARLPLLGREVRLVATPGLRGVFRRDDELLVGDPLRRSARAAAQWPAGGNAPSDTQGIGPGPAGTAPGTPADPRAQDWRRRVLAWLRARA
ncbi:MAG: M48 family metallopeptidase, partial [Betaproteobacteria bacterium]|nr:M48 family metallopeptidase [Betaproteobacteria bacterium]